MRLTFEESGAVLWNADIFLLFNLSSWHCHLFYCHRQSFEIRSCYSPTIAMKIMHNATLINLLFLSFFFFLCFFLSLLFLSFFVVSFFLCFFLFLSFFLSFVRSFVRSFVYFLIKKVYTNLCLRKTHTNLSLSVQQWLLDQFWDFLVNLKGKLGR